LLSLHNKKRKKFTLYDYEERVATRL